MGGFATGWRQSFSGITLSNAAAVSVLKLGWCRGASWRALQPAHFSHTPRRSCALLRILLCPYAQSTRGTLPRTWPRRSWSRRWRVRAAAAAAVLVAATSSPPDSCLTHPASPAPQSCLSAALTLRNTRWVRGWLLTICCPPAVQPPMGSAAQPPAPCPLPTARRREALRDHQPGGGAQLWQLPAPACHAGPGSAL